MPLVGAGRGAPDSGRWPPGVFFVWLALSALRLGLLVFVLPMPCPFNWLLFAVLSVVAVVVGRVTWAASLGGEEGDRLNMGAHRWRAAPSP